MLAAADELEYRVLALDVVATDEELLEAWRRGSTAAGEDLFERHFDAVMRFFRNKLDEGPEELVQRTFLACIESRDRFRGDASFRTFLFSVAHNVLKNHFRSKRRRGVHIDFSADSVYGLAPSPSTIVARERNHRLLLDALRRIPIDAQVALELQYWENLSGLEIAEVLGVPLGTAKTRLRRARQLLATALEPLAHAESFDIAGADLDAWARDLRQAVLQ